MRLIAVVLPAPFWSEDGDALAGLDVEVHAAKRFDRTVRFVHTDKLDHRPADAPICHHEQPPWARPARATS
jgi:hypothetical protein